MDKANIENFKIPDMLRKDATDEPIRIGMIYGYSRNANGVSYVIIGKAKNLTKKGVTLEVIERKSALYNDNLTMEKNVTSKTVNVKANLIFPLYHLV